MVVIDLVPEKKSLGVISVTRVTELLRSADRRLAALIAKGQVSGASRAN